MSKDSFASTEMVVVFALYGPVELEVEVLSDDPGPEWVDHLVDSCGSLAQLTTGEWEVEQQLERLAEWGIELEVPIRIELKAHWYQTYFGDHDVDIDFEVLPGPVRETWNRDDWGWPPLEDT